ncbi:MAG: DUF4832 domain-containing protein [Planctomycetaceae bacterium]|nr:MAG: DUF4832 domain-containing protein [Planctomycetaceae bacterium]
MIRISIAVILVGLVADVAWGQSVVVTPEETDEILANPGMGWQTFHRTRAQDKNLPSWIPSTVHYARWGWRELEPRPGQLDYAFLDGILKETREAGQTLAFRVMCCSTYPRQPYHPAWLTEISGKVVTTRYASGPELEVPVLDDPQTLAAHLDFIDRLGNRYDGHPDIEHIDLGTVGWWGEWHMSQSSDAPMPTIETQKKIVDAYLAAFKKTPLVMLIGGGEMLKYAVENGAGWRADCLGDMGGFSKTWCHMRMAYPKMLPAADAGDAWKTAPVAWETCWDMRKWVDEGWSLRFIFNYALALHGSFINNKSAPLPEGENIRLEVERFLRRLGYRLVLKELSHPSTAQPGEDIQLAMKWQNMGSAPCYRPYRVAYRLTDEQGNERPLVGSVTVNKWLPGSIDLFTEEFFKQPADLPPGEVHAVVDTISLPDDLLPGSYALSLAVVGETDTKPVVQLGIKGRSEDGWYPLSRLTISK